MYVLNKVFKKTVFYSELLSRRIGFRRESGFTYVELLVVLAVTSMLCSYMVLYGNRSRQQIGLMVESARLSQVIAKAKSLAITAYNGSSSSVCGYGVQLNYPSSYVLFHYDLPRDQCASLSSVSSSAINIINQYTVDQGITIGMGGSPVQDILFVPPEPKTFLWNGASFTTGNSQILLQTTAGLSNIITVDSFGSISM